MQRCGCTYPDSTFSVGKSNGCAELKLSEGEGRKKKKRLYSTACCFENICQSVWAGTTLAILSCASSLKKGTKRAQLGAEKQGERHKVGLGQEGGGGRGMGGGHFIWTS